jgi:aminopeptidase N
MEHQTIIAYGNGFRDEQYDWLHNHELAHEWWGNLVTCRDWKDMWLHEGFGTYMQPLYREVRFGPKAYAVEIAKYRMLHRTPLAPRESKDSHEIYFGASGNDIYYKGSAVLHTLRWQMGDGPFATALRKFCYPTEAAQQATDGSQCRFVDTDDFIRLCSDLANEDLTWFFDVYVRQPSLPRLQWKKSDGKLELQWLVPSGAKFELVVPIEVRGQEVRVPMPGGKGTLPIGDADYRLDPRLRLLMGKPVEVR